MNYQHLSLKRKSRQILLMERLVYKNYGNKPQNGNNAPQNGNKPQGNNAPQGGNKPQGNNAPQE